MLFPFRKVFYILLFNLSLFLILMIGIQNSTNKKKVNLIIGETISLPVGFIIGVSFICGSITAGVIATNSNNIKK